MNSRQTHSSRQRSATPGGECGGQRGGQRHRDAALKTDRTSLRKLSTNCLSRVRQGSSSRTIPEIAWELSLGIYLTAKGFKAAPIIATTCTTGHV